MRRKAFLLWWRNLKKNIFLRKHYSRIRVVAAFHDASEIGPDEILLIGDNMNPKWALLKCPCGCGETIHVNLMGSQHPHWTISREQGGSLSFYPSLWVDESLCGSHFFIWHGRVHWCSSCYMMK